MDIKRYAVVGYLVIALLTFGYAASDPKPTERMFNDHISSVVNPGYMETETKALKGLMSGMLWPLYWSWMLGEQVRG